MNFLNQHLTEILAFISGIFAGGIGGITLTRSYYKKINTHKVIQKGINAGGDVAGGNIRK